MTPVLRGKSPRVRPVVEGPGPAQRRLPGVQIGWSGLLDPDRDTWAFLHGGGPMNLAAYKKVDVGRSLDQARATDDVTEPRALTGAVWKIVGVEEPMAYLWTTRDIAGISKRVSGDRSLADGLVRLQGVSLSN